MTFKQFLGLLLILGMVWLVLRVPDNPSPPVPVPVPDDVPLPTPPVPITPVEPEFVLLSAFTSPRDNSVFGDIMAHAPNGPVGGDRDTNAHETTHDINNHIRNKHQGSPRVNGFYCLKDRGVVVQEPGIRKSDVCQFVPACLRTDRYELYVSGQPAWNEQPLYIVDEWVAYTLGAKVNVDDVQEGRHKGEWSDGVAGCLELGLYTVALGMAVKEKDPEYWKTNEQFRRFLVYWGRESEKAYVAGSVMKEFRWAKQDALLIALRTDPSCESMRKFLREHVYGLWLGFPIPSKERNNADLIRDRDRRPPRGRLHR